MMHRSCSCADGWRSWCGRGTAAALRQRPETGLLAGLWEYPHVPGALAEAEAARQIRERVRQMDGGEYYAVVTVENPYV